MRHTPRTRWQLRLVNASFVALFLLVVALLQWVGREYHLQFDWTQARRTTLSDASRAVLERLDGPVSVTAFASERGEARRTIRELIERYQRVRPDVQLSFVNPDTDPERVRVAGVQFDGELLLEYGDAKEKLSPAALNEEAITNALTRLGRRGERWLVFLSGHGERSPDRQANFDVSVWARELHKRGFKTQAVSLANNSRIPQNTSVLVLAGARVALTPAEVREIESYIARGGNLLWLGDPGPLHGLERIAEMLGVEFQPGVLVDPELSSSTGAPPVAVGQYSAHVAIRDFGYNSYFLEACGISLQAPKGWKGAELFQTLPRVWSETEFRKGQTPHFDKGKDLPGPFNLAVALTRDVDKREQRIVVTGDGDFLSNSFVGYAGNLELGMSLVNWLSHDDAYINIPVRVARDRVLALPPAAELSLIGTFLVGVPLAIIAGGTAVWLRRRKR